MTIIVYSSVICYCEGSTSVTIQNLIIMLSVFVLIGKAVLVEKNQLFCVGAYTMEASSVRYRWEAMAAGAVIARASVTVQYRQRDSFVLSRARGIMIRRDCGLYGMLYLLIAFASLLSYAYIIH